MSTHAQTARDTNAKSAPNAGTQTPGPSAGKRLMRGAAQDGMESQEALLSPDAGLLTPSKVDAALGYNQGQRQPPGFVRAGQTVRVEIDGIGILRNPVVADT